MVSTLWKMDGEELQQPLDRNQQRVASKRKSETRESLQGKIEGTQMKVLEDGSSRKHRKTV